MKRAVVAASAVVLSGVAVVALNSREESCPTTFEFKGRAYVEYETTEEVTPRNMLGSATQSGCGHEGPYALPVGMYNIEGVRPDVAIVSAVNARAIYLARGATVSDLPPDVADVVADQTGTAQPRQ